MEAVISRLTIYFEEPFWVGVYEREEAGKLSACRVVFGAEPKDYDVYEQFLKSWSSLKLSPPVKGSGPVRRVENPKRLQRQAKQAMAVQGVGTKAQQALQLMREQNKLERNSARKRRSEEEKKRQFELHQQKKREKHRGR